MSSNSSGVKRYQMIRDYLSLIYLYGFFSREDFQKLIPKKTASYDICIKYIKDIYPELLDGQFRGRKKYLAVDRTKLPEDEDRLGNTYFLSTLADDELSEVLHILAELALQPSRAADMAYLLDENASPSTLRRWINALADFGYLEQDASHRFSVRESFLRRLTDDELTDLYRYVRFCGSVTYPRVPARFLLRTIEREYLKRGLPLPWRSLFLFRNNPNHNVLEEDYVFTLLDAIRRKRTVEITVSRRGREARFSAIPICLRIDRRLGRWYLLSMERQPAIRRLSFIREIALLDQCEPRMWEQAKEAVDKAFEHSRFSDLIPASGPTALRMRLHFEQPGLERQFLRELRGGEIITEDDQRVYCDIINDPIELVPLLRSYSPWIEPENPEGAAEQRIREGLLRMKQQLCGEAKI